MRADGLVIDDIRVTDVYEDDPIEARMCYVSQCPVCGDGTAYYTTRDDPAKFKSMSHGDPSSHHFRCVMPRV